MAARSEPAAQPAADREIVITRLLDAPRQLVWQAWTDPKHVPNWWGPTGFTNTFQKFDVRPGGVWLFVMHGPDGTDYPNRIVFEEVVEPERLVYSHGGGKKGDSTDFHVTVTFAEQDGRTRLTLRSVFPSAAERERVVREYGALEGAYQHVDRLQGWLAGLRGEFFIARVFDAPRELVWKAWTEPERLANWWGPKGFKMRAVKLDLRPGGVFHYSMQAPPGSPMDNAVMWGKFVYREIVKPERMVFVNSFSDERGGITRHPMSATWPLEVLSTLTFTERLGKTAVALRGGPIHATEEERRTFEAGRDSMRQGFGGTFDQLAEYLAQA